MARAEIRVLLADEQPLFREAVRMILDGQDDLRIVAEAGDGPSTVDQARLASPDVALVSMALNDYSGIRTTRALAREVPACRVITLAPKEDPSTLIDAIEAGASGYLSKESPVTDLVDAIHRVHQEGILVPQRLLPTLIRGLVTRRRDLDDESARYEKLTSREHDVLRLLARGADNQLIARALVISPQTARTHVQNILVKLRVHSRLEAVAFARRMAARAAANGQGGRGNSVA